MSINSPGIMNFGVNTAYGQGMNQLQVDSTQVHKTKSVFSPQNTNQATTSNSRTTPAGQHLQTLSSPPPKPAPKPPAAKEATVNITSSTNDAGTTVGSFDTNIPTFKNLNTKSTPATAVANGVGIYGGTADDLVISEDKTATPPTTTVAFKNKNISLTFNTPEGDANKSSIVFDPQTGVYAFNNLDGIRLEAAHSGPQNKGKGGESFLINGGTVDFINTCERQSETSTNSKYNLLNEGVQTQNIVLKDVKVKEGAITLGNDNLLALGQTDLNTSQIQALDRYKEGNNTPRTRSHIAYEGHDNELSRANVQTGFSVHEAYTGWLGGTKADMKLIKADEEKGTIKVESEIFSGVNMKDVNVARTVGNLKIYTKNESGANISIVSNADKTNTIRFYGQELEFVIPSEQPENARIFVDEATGTLYFENLQGVRYNGISEGYDVTQVNLFLKDCHLEFLNTLETISSGGKAIASYDVGNKTRSNIALAGTTTVDVLVASYDNIYMDKDAVVGKYAGYKNSAPEQLNAMNHQGIKNIEAQIKTPEYEGNGSKLGDAFRYIQGIIKGK